MWPVWVANVRLPRGTRSEWKLLIRGPAGDRWESLGGSSGNRELEAEAHGTHGAWVVRFGEAGRISAPRSEPGSGSGGAVPPPGVVPPTGGGIVGGVDGN
jgi:hypothetical protein